MVLPSLKLQVISDFKIELFFFFVPITWLIPQRCAANTMYLDFSKGFNNICCSFEVDRKMDTG